MAAITQVHAYMPLSGRRYGSFAGRAAYVPPADEPTASFVLADEVVVPRHHFPRSSSHVGARHHHAFSVFFPGLRPAGA